MKIVVLVKQVPDTWGDRRLDPATGRVARDETERTFDEISERAMEVALSYKDAADAEVVAMAMGPAPANDTLRKALAMGADSAVHVLDDELEGADLRTTARVLAEAIRRSGFDLVIAGNESTDGRGGVIPAMISEHLSVPHATFLGAIELSDGAVTGERDSEYGTITLRTTLPAIVSVTERSAEPRFASFKGIMKAKKKTIETVSLHDLQLDPTVLRKTGRSTVVDVLERPARTAGRKVIDDGQGGSEIATFLTENRLI